MSGRAFPTGLSRGIPVADEPAPEAARSSFLRESQGAMNGRPLQQKVVIANSQGLHMRPAAAFAELARRFQSTVKVIKDDKCVNGQSPLDLMLLVAEQGSELVVEVDGPDAEAALAALVELLTNLTKEDAEPPLPQKG